jgi:hypothetical protein
MIYTINVLLDNIYVRFSTQIVRQIPPLQTTIYYGMYPI